jgi:predicted ester cyclase
MKKLLLALLLLALPLRAQEPAPAPGSPEANKEVVRRYLQILGGGALEQLDQVLGPDFVDRTPGASPNVYGPEAIRQSQRKARDLFQDIHYGVDDLIAEGDRVAARYTVRATRKGNGAMGLPVQVIGVTLFRIADGKIREAWIVNDQIELFRQLGFTIRPPQTETPKPPKPPSKPPSKT